MRLRPVALAGLRCIPNSRQVLKAAGINLKDISHGANLVRGSRNPVNVVKAAFSMLWAVHAPLGVGDRK